jgi:integrase
MAGRRGNNEGSLTKRPDGRWEARITLADGKRKSFYGKTRQEAAKRLAAAVRDQIVGLPIVGEKQTLVQYLDHWLEVAKPTIKPRTYHLYEMFVRVHIVPSLGTTALARLSPQHIQAFYAGRLAAGLSSTSVRHIHDVLHRALDAALKLGLVQRNVTELIDPPRMRHHEMTVLTPEQVRTFLAAAKGDRYFALYVLALTTGMRQGELLALKWRDVDLEGAKLNVRATLQPVKGQGFVLSAPKTKRSRRTIALTSAAVDALRDHQREQEIEREKLGAAWADHGSYSPIQWGVRSMGFISCSAISARSWKALALLASASTISATRRQRFCSGRALIPRSSLRCSGMRKWQSHWISTATSCPTCRSKRRQQWTLYWRSDTSSRLVIEGCRGTL